MGYIDLSLMRPSMHREYPQLTFELWEVVQPWLRMGFSMAELHPCIERSDKGVAYTCEPSVQYVRKLLGLEPPDFAKQLMKIIEDQDAEYFRQLAADWDNGWHLGLS
jgi:hypothetical protein